MPPSSPKRILLKLSGEALCGKEGYGVGGAALQKTAQALLELTQKGVELAVVLGGGNIFRGIQEGPLVGIDRTPADQMGMVATLINGIALSQALQKLGIEARLMSALECPAVAERYQWQKALRHLKKGRVLIFVGGTGHPYFTTDTNAALRACEIKADLLLKATTHVDGIYDKDPRKHSDAKRYTRLSYSEALSEKLGIFDLTAVTLCMSNHIPIRVFNFFKETLVDAVVKEDVGTLVTGE